MDKKVTDSGKVPILIICNEPSTAPVWGYMIREKKLQAVIETDPDKTITRCEEIEPSLTIFDLNLQPSKILDLCLKLRAICENPMLVFMPAYDENLILEYYDSGIDDCVIKPISPPVFYAKVRAWLRHSDRHPVGAMQEIHVEAIRLDPNKNLLVNGNGIEIKLTDLEVRFLHLLMSRPGQVFDSDTIVNQVWGLYGEQDVTLLKHLVYRLRRKLDDDPEDPRWIQTWHGVGYSFKAR